jgi:cell division protease FtsH
VNGEGRSTTRRSRAIADAVRRWRRTRAINKGPGGNRLNVALLGLVLYFFAAFGWSLWYIQPRSPGREITLNALSGLAQEQRVVTAVFRDQDSRIEGVYLVDPNRKAANLPANASLKGPQFTSYWVSYPQGGSVTNTIFTQLNSQTGAIVSTDSQLSKSVVRMMATFLFPLLILASLFAFLFTLGRGAGSALGSVLTFGSISQKRLRKGQVRPITFGDVAGADEALEELKEVRDYLADPRRYEALGALPPKGVLLVGPPGCGKTLLAKATAGEVGVPFFSVAGAEFVESLVGVGAARIRDLFRRVRAAAPAIVFIDEIDAAGRKRAVGGGTGGTDEREQTLNQLLVEMDGFEVSSGIVVIGATNRPDILDPALLRPGRFDRHVTVDLPDQAGRANILELHARGKPILPDVDFGYLARRTPGFSGADLASVVNEGALLAIRAGRSEVGVPDLDAAIERVTMGTARRGRLLTPEERRRAAYHEAGHVIVAAAGGVVSAAVRRVSILGRGHTVGSTRVEREERQSLRTRRQLEAQAMTLLGGIAAEELIFGETSTGAEKDLEQATDLARDMVARFGMSQRLGRARLVSKNVDEFLDAEAALAALSADTHEQVDNEIRAILAECERQATKMLKAHRDALDTLAATLEREESLEGASLDVILASVASSAETLPGIGVGGNGRSSAPRTAARSRKPASPTRDPGRKRVTR